MRPAKIKDRCTKRKLKKCEEIAKTYDKIQTKYCLCGTENVRRHDDLHRLHRRGERDCRQYVSAVRD